MNEVVLTGRGMHSGEVARIALRRTVGENVLCVAGDRIRIQEWVAVPADRATVIRAKEHRVRTVEHLFAALGALSIYESLEIEVVGAELPLLDGASLHFAQALLALEIPAAHPRLCIVRRGEVVVDESVYRFEPDRTRSVRVSIDFGDSRLEPSAEWNGDPTDFVVRIASARTFAPEKDVSHLLASGLASHVTRESVVVIGNKQILSSGKPFASDEPVRHKLIDLMGDLYLYGGPPIGRIEAAKPGHSRTHEAIQTALSLGILVQR